MRKAMAAVVASALAWSGPAASWAGGGIVLAESRGTAPVAVTAPVAPLGRSQADASPILTPFSFSAPLPGAGLAIRGVSIEAEMPGAARSATPFLARAAGGIVLPAGVIAASGFRAAPEAPNGIDLPPNAISATTARALRGSAPRIIVANASTPLPGVAIGRPGQSPLNRLTRLGAILKGSQGAPRTSAANVAAAIDSVYDMTSPHPAEEASALAPTPSGVLVPRWLAEAASREASAAPGGGAREKIERMIGDGYHTVPKPAAPWGGVVPSLTAAVALTALGAWVMRVVHLPHATITDVGGWIGALIMMSFPTLHLLEIRREKAEIAHGGERARLACETLAGSSADSHVVLMGGKLLQWFGIYASGAPALIFNVLGRVALSWTVMLDLRRVGALSKWKFAAVTAAVAGLLVATPWIVPLANLITGLGVAGACIYATFTLPQYVLNHSSFLRLRSLDHEEAFAHFFRLRSNKLLMYGLMLTGDVLLLLEYWSHGLVYNAVACLFAALVLLLILGQMQSAKVMPWHAKAGKR